MFVEGDIPPTVILTVSSSEEISSRKFATIVCSIIDFQPKSMTVKWLKNGQPMDSGIVTSPACEVNGKFSASSRLRVSAREWFSKAIYTCQVTHQGFTQSQNISGSQGKRLKQRKKIIPLLIEIRDLLKLVQSMEQPLRYCHVVCCIRRVPHSEFHHNRLFVTPS